jgi:molybdate/tungstate transport system permease protein
MRAHTLLATHRITQRNRLPYEHARWPRYPSGVILALIGAALAVYIALPLAALLFNVSSVQLRAALADPTTHSAIVTSLFSATLATLLVLVFGVPLAYILARYSFPGRALIGGLVYLPLVLPPVVGGVLLLVVWGPHGAIGHLFDVHGIDFVDHISGIILAQMFVAAPFIVVAARSAFESIEPELEEMARTQGAATLRIFWSISLPLALRAILAGATLSWMRAFGEFGATVIMAYHPYSFPVYTLVQFQSVGLAPVLPLALLALILGAITVVVAGLLQRS